MSFNQSTSDKNETQYRKTGRSASSNQQHRGYSPAYPKGTGATVSVTNVSPQVSGMAPAQRGGVQNGAHAQPQLHAPGTASNGVSIQVGMSMPMPFHQPQVPVQFGGPNQQIQYQSMSTSSIQMPMPMQLPIRSTQVQQPVFVPGLQPHPMQPQGIMHQSQNLTFTPQMGPQIPQMGNLGISMASQCPQQQGSNFGVLRDPCAQTPVQQHVRGILPGPAHSVGHQGGMQRNNSEADRWQRATNFQPKGLMPSPHTPLQVMNQSDRKNGVGKVRDEEQAKQTQLRAILNKLTPQNFEKLFEQVKAVNIDNATTLTGVVSQIFDKALMRPTFCEMYANFCFYLAGELPDFSEDNEKITFKRLLLNKCQEEFERGGREQEETDKADEEGQVKQSEEEREEKRIKVRRRRLGNISLIGELYKKRMLTERVMHECIKKLFGQQQTPDEHDIEVLCKLMSTIGEMIDHPKAKEYMDAYFERMKSLSNNMNLSSRVRFMLNDAIDLRKNKWQQRRKVEGRIKIEEVHRDAAQERQAQSSRLTRGPGINPSARRGPPMQFSPRGSTMLSSPNAHMGGFRGMPAQVRGYGSQDARTDERHSYESRTLSVPLTQRPIGDDSITLGPQGGLARGMSIRGPPSMSAAPLAEMPPSAGDSRRMTAGSNGFSSLSERTTYNPREDPVPRYMPDRFSGPAAYDQSSVSERNLSFGGRDLRSSDHRTLPTSPPTSAHGATLTQNVPSENVLTEDHLRDMSLAAIKEFYSARDEKEVALCIKELNSPSFHPSMISLWITDSFERKDAERDLLAKLLVNLTKTNDATLSQSQLIKGFETVLSTLEDTVIDTPRAPEFLGLIFTKVILGTSFP